MLILRKSSRVVLVCVLTKDKRQKCDVRRKNFCEKQKKKNFRKEIARTQHATNNNNLLVHHETQKQARLCSSVCFCLSLECIPRVRVLLLCDEEGDDDDDEREERERKKWSRRRRERIEPVRRKTRRRNAKRRGTSSVRGTSRRPPPKCAASSASSNERPRGEGTIAVRKRTDLFVWRRESRKERTVEKDTSFDEDDG